MTSQFDDYLVGARAPGAGEAALGRFIESLAGRSDAEIVSARTGGPLVVRISREALEELRRDFGNELIIEPDAPLKL
jgi:hypothetical protein